MEDAVGINVMMGTNNAVQNPGKLVVVDKLKVLCVQLSKDTIEIPYQDRGNMGSAARPEGVEDGITLPDNFSGVTGREVKVEEGERADGSRLDIARRNHLHPSIRDPREDGHGPARLGGGREPNLVSRG
jgi:hypothetical protein